MLQLQITHKADIKKNKNNETKPQTNYPEKPMFKSINNPMGTFGVWGTPAGEVMA